MAMVLESTVILDCPKCGSRHSVTFTDYPERDKGSLDCKADGCGGILIRWNGTRDYHVATLIEKPKNELQ